MRIGISCYPTHGGSGAVATELGKALADRGHQVHFIVAGVPFRLGGFHHNITVHEVETVSYPVLRTPPYDFSLAAAMADTAVRFRLDILHVHYAFPFAVCAHLAKEMIGPHPLKVVTTLHGTDVTVLAQDKSLYRLIKLGIERSDAVTAVSQSLVRQTRELFHVDRDIVCVYNFVNTKVFRPVPNSPVRRCFAPGNEKILLHISNFRAVKRVPDVVRVFRQVRDVMPAKLVLVGEGPDSGAAREAVEALGLTDDVYFLGRQDEVADLFAAADLFLLPSEKESFGLVALEAMASGVPVVGSNAGGIPEVVRDGETGFLAPVGDVDTMARRALELLSDPLLYQRFSRRARERAVTHFDQPEKVSEYESLYRALVAHG
ncbi:MAG: N-acetyl-alpha-D-glucosaminyl L-malate synthase BshA [Alicyclobacillaceae bacterium]|nr:N-acetyl-alpha-D-glucosaminyl L-malate synthase BshA [Alicyclobacillaceae bacterium]